MNLDVKFSESTQVLQADVSEQRAAIPTDLGHTTVVHNGQNGATFYPTVSEEGVISWTNDRELENPLPVNIKGETGKKGDPGKDGVNGENGKDGKDGKDGYTPVKGVDYFDGKDGADGKNGTDGKDGYTPIKGVDYFDGKDGTNGTNGIDGKDGADGHTPVKGTDYFTDADKQEMVEEVIAQIPPSGVSDVQMNGVTVVENGVANIPLAPTSGGVGLVRLGKSANGNMYMGNSNGAIVLLYPVAADKGFQNRKAQGSQYSGVVNSANIDLAVKYAMTDGVGAEWTDAQQAAARARMGAVSLEEVLAELEKRGVI